MKRKEKKERTSAWKAHYLQANCEPLLKWTSAHSQSEIILFLVWSANGDGSALNFKANFQVNLLNDDIYQWAIATIIVSSLGQIELIYKFDEESTMSI